MTKMQGKPNKKYPSSSRSEFWGICCESGKKYSQVVGKKFHVTMAALDPTVLNTSPCVSLLVERGGSQYLLCNLKPDSILQVNLNLFFDKGEKISFYLKGLGTVHLSGYHVCDGDQTTSENSNKSVVISSFKEESSEEEEDSDSEDEEEEEMKNLKKGSALTKAATPTGKKTNMPSVISGKGPQAKKSNAPAAASTKMSQATPVKKPPDSQIKKPVTPKALPKKKESSEEEESSSEESSDMDEDDDEMSFKKPAKVSNVVTAKRQRPTADEENSDSEEESSDEKWEEESNKKRNADLTQKLNDFMNKKRPKMDTSTPARQSNKKKATPVTFKSSTEVIDLVDSDSKASKRSFNLSELNSSIGRTPMPKKKVSSIHQLSTSFSNTSGLNKNLNKSFDDDDDDENDEDDESDEEENVAKSHSLQQVTTPTQGTETEAKKKKKKKKNKAGANESQIETSPIKKGVQSPFKLQAKSPSGKKLPGGVECEDIRIGSGLEAKKGKLVHVYYTGKLTNNKVFDSRGPGSKPFSFKLGADQVIKGWDIGVEGMKVGGKRKLTIPPHMGYKNQKMGDIPPNSTLHFVIELRAVS